MRVDGILFRIGPMCKSLCLLYFDGVICRIEQNVVKMCNLLTMTLIFLYVYDE